MSAEDLLLRAIDSGVAIVAVIAFYKICIKLIEKNST